MLMRRFLIVVALLAALNVAAQQKMKDVLRCMPDNILPYLTANNLLDCIDFKEANMKAEVHHSLEGKSQLVALGDYYADFVLNEAHRMQLRLLDVTVPVDSCRQVVCVVDTYGTDARESTVRFFSTHWRQLPTMHYVSIPFSVFTAVLDPEHLTLEVTPSNYLECPAFEEQKEVVVLPTKLNWEQNSFK